MKTKHASVYTYIFVSVLSLGMMIACGESKNAPISKVGVQQGPTPVPSQQGANQLPASQQQTAQTPGQKQGTAPTTTPPATQPQVDLNKNLPIAVTLKNQEPLITLMQKALGDNVTKLINNPEATGPVNIKAQMDLNLKKLVSADPGNADADIGSGSTFAMKVSLSNSLDKPILLSLTSTKPIITVTQDDDGKTKIIANFAFLPEKEASSPLMSITANGIITKSSDSTETKVYSGTVSLLDDTGRSTTIGTFTTPLSQVVSANDLAKLGNDDSTTPQPQDAPLAAPATDDSAMPQ